MKKIKKNYLFNVKKFSKSSFDDLENFLRLYIFTNYTFLPIITLLAL